MGPSRSIFTPPRHDNDDDDDEFRTIISRMRIPRWGRRMIQPVYMYIYTPPAEEQS